MMSFKVVAINSQGFFEGDINQFLNKHREKPDVLVVTEHKQRNLGAIRNSVHDYILAAGYPAITGQRGTAVFVRNDIEFKRRPDLDRFSEEGIFESASVQIYRAGDNLVVTGLYKSPNSSIKKFNSVLKEFVGYIGYEKYVIGGDINIDFYNKGATTKQLLNECNLRYHIRSATHDMGGYLDNFITSKDSGCKGKRLTSMFSDHRPIQLVVPLMPRYQELMARVAQYPWNGYF